MAKGKQRGRQGRRRPQERGKIVVVEAGATRIKGKQQAEPLAASIFTVRNSDLERLTPEHAVELTRELLWVEARRIGLPTTSINATSWIDVPDGGVDATVEGDASRLKSALIKPGRAAFQIKAGARFQPWNDSHIREALFGNKKTPNKENLGAGVKACLDSKGTYVLVCTKVDLPDAQQRKAVELLKKYFSDCGYSDAKVEVWSQNKLIGFLQRFPSLSLKINEHEKAKFQAHISWSQQDDMKKAFKAGDQQKQFVSNLENELRRSDEAVHVRVVGEPGVGKTRLVLEGTAAHDLAPLVLYCDSATKFRDSELMNELLKEDNDFAAILVVDECDPDARSYIWNKLKHCGARIKLVSIYNERDETGGNIAYADAPPLGKDEIVAIIREYGVPKDKVERWAEFCSGSPRVAHVIGWNLKNNPEDLLKPPDTFNIWDRYIVGGDDPQSARVEQRRLVLRHLALFKRFGYGARVDAEARAIAKIVQEADSQITWARFQEIVKELCDRKILQGETTLYITPKALHIKLWADWWDTYGASFEPEAFATKLTGKLLEWSDEMFKYAAESEAALRVVGQLLGESGPFQGGNYLDDSRGADLFLALTEANPKTALDCLKNTVGNWGQERLLSFTTGRREVVWALERIVIWRELFQDGARLLLRLGERENETWGNNASGVFAGLFSPGWGATAPTEAPPEERFPVLKEALESDSKEQRRLALRACDRALESHYFTRASGAEYQGLRREPRLWSPQTWGELLDAYRRVWQLICDHLDTLPDDEKKQAVDVLLKQTRGLARYHNLLDMLIDTLARLGREPYVDKRKIFETVQRILHYDGKEMPVEVRNRWEELRDALLGSDFHSLMERYVAMDLLEDRVDDEGESADKAGPQIDNLAVQAVQQPEFLSEELTWLVTNTAQNGFRFGYALGSRDAGFTLLPRLFSAQRSAGANGSAFFLGGYFRAIREKDPQRWETLLDELAADENLAISVPELTWRSGLTDRAALRILNLAKKGIISVAHFQMFGFGSAIAELAEDIFRQWIECLLNDSSREAVSIALDLCHFYYGRKESKHRLPRELTLRLLTASSLFQKSDTRRASQMDDYHWTELGKQFVRKYPTESLELADKMLEHFGEDGTIIGDFHSSTQAVLDEITRQLPSEVWQRVTKYIGPPVDSRAYHITHWLRGGEFYTRGKNGVLPLVPLKDIWQWVDRNVETRASYLASFVPALLSRTEGEVCLAREVLIRYGARKDVRSNLMANCSTEGWSGPSSLHHQSKKQWLLDFKNGETNANVRRWIDEYAASLDRRIEWDKLEEEREQ